MDLVLLDSRLATFSYPSKDVILIPNTTETKGINTSDQESSGYR